MVDGDDGSDDRESCGGGDDGDDDDVRCSRVTVETTRPWICGARGDRGMTRLRASDRRICRRPWGR